MPGGPSLCLVKIAFKDGDRHCLLEPHRKRAVILAPTVPVGDRQLNVRIFACSRIGSAFEEAILSDFKALGEFSGIGEPC
ncbi:hypothetical protein D3C71_1965280 [compost metagenome]